MRQRRQPEEADASGRESPGGHVLTIELSKCGVMRTQLRLAPCASPRFIALPTASHAEWSADRERCQSALEMAASAFNRNVGVNVGKAVV